MYTISTIFNNSIIKFADNPNTRLIVPHDPENTDYQQFLDYIIKNGTSDIDGDVTEQALDDVAIRKFRIQLQKYTQAVTRLAKRDLSIAVPAVVEETVIGYEHNDVTGLSEAVVETVTVTEEIPAEPATVTVDEEEIANPVLVKDQEERAAAQAIQAATPPDVVTAYENSLKT